jgi:hypothetical protein
MRPNNKKSWNLAPGVGYMMVGNGKMSPEGKIYSKGDLIGNR